MKDIEYHNRIAVYCPIGNIIYLVNIYKKFTNKRVFK
jgi:hypothetical protein